jgi:hypothetical protein
MMNLYPGIEDLSISTNAPSISVHDIEALCFDVEFCVLRYRCFFVGSSLGCCSSYSVLDTDCSACTLHCESIIKMAHASPGPPSAATAEPALGGAAAPDEQSTSAGPSRAALGLGPTAYFKLNLVPESPWPSRRLARFPSRRIVNHNHGLSNGSSQSSHGGGVLVMPDTRNHQRNAGACDSILRENDGLAPSLELE